VTAVAEWQLGERPDLLDEPGTRAVVLAASRDPNAKMTVLLLEEGSSSLGRVVKVPTTDEAATAVAREAAILAELDVRLAGSLRATVPTMLGTVEVAGRVALVVEVLPGTPMATGYHGFHHVARPAAVAADFGAAESWLAAFQLATSGPLMRLTMGEQVIDGVERRFAGHPHVGNVLRALGRIEGRLGSEQVPRTAVHGDFWFGNLLVDAGEVRGVVDWEAATMAGAPVRDLARFALSYALYLDRHTRAGRRIPGHPGLRAGTWGAGIRYAIEGTGWFPARARQSVAEGLCRLGASPHLVGNVLIAGVAEMASSADHGGFARRHFDLLADLCERGSR
jgi:Phosphotransferase enzyme family